MKRVAKIAISLFVLGLIVLPQWAPVNAVSWTPPYNPGLTGSVPALGGHTSLQVLRLDNSGLSGNIPALDSLTALRQLYLSSNGLTGTIPSLGHLTMLRQLELSSNALSGTIPDLHTLNALQTLYLYTNKLEGACWGCPRHTQKGHHGMFPRIPVVHRRHPGVHRQAHQPARALLVQE